MTTTKFSVNWTIRSSSLPTVKCNKAPDRVVRGFTKVDPPGIEPGSSVILPGLLRAQFAQYLYLALQVRRTCLDGGPSQH